LYNKEFTQLNVTSQVFNNNPQGGQLTGQLKNRWWNCVKTDINKLQIGKRGKQQS